MSSSTYLGLPFHIAETDAHLTSALCSRATAAFFTNKPLLTCRFVLPGQRLRMFGTLVTSSLRWSLCVLPVAQCNLQRLRVHHSTLLTWLLGGRAHVSWFSVECIGALRHGVKMWAGAFAEQWGCLLAAMVWQWLAMFSAWRPHEFGPSCSAVFAKHRYHTGFSPLQNRAR